MAKTKPEEAIGNAILSVVNIILYLLKGGKSNTKKNNLISDYLRDTPKKQRIKDLIFIGSIMWLLVFTGWVMSNKDMFDRPYIKILGDNGYVTVGGNCSWIWELWQRERQRNIDVLGWRNIIINESDPINKSNVLWNSPKMSSPRVSFQTTTLPSIIVDTTTTTQPPSCPECMVCPDCICNYGNHTLVCDPCAELECIENSEALAYINRLRPTAESVAYQGGWFDMRNICRKLLGGNASKFKEGPRYSLTQIYDTLINKNGTYSDRVMFPDVSAAGSTPEFILNTSIWRISGNGSIKHIYKINKWVENDTHIFAED